MKMIMNVDYEGDQYGVTPDAKVRLRDMVKATIEPGPLRFYWAGWILHNVRFTIELGNPHRLDQALSLGERHFE